MMRRTTALALAAALLGGLLAVPAAPAGAQNGGSMLDAPRLGFEIDPKAGNVGDTVDAQVDPVDVQEHCHTTIQDVRQMFRDFDGPTNDARTSPGPTFFDYMMQGPAIGIDVPDEWPVNPGIPHPVPGLPPIVPPSIEEPPPGVDPLVWTWAITFRPSIPDPTMDSAEKVAALALWYFFDSILGYAAGSPPHNPDAGGHPQAHEYLAQTFILTFVDPVTQDLVGELGSFDPASGQGQIDTPGLEPGLWAVAAACVEPAITNESFMAAIQVGAEFVNDNNVPIPLNNLTAYAPPGEEAGWLIAQLVPIMLPELMAPRALGIDFYCILQDDGFCATPPDPVGLLAELSEEELAEFADLEAGDGVGDGDAGPDGLAVEPVSAAPAFTG